jgi:hypothetical protein
MSCKHDCTQPPLFPRAIFNRPGLARIDYRIGNYAQVRAHMLDALNQQAPLAAFTHRHVDDPAIALLEADAIVVDILTFYQSLYANEAWLRTVQWPESISELVRLGGYRLAPGIGGEAVFALTVKGSKPVTVPMGFGLKAQIDGIAKPVDFETEAALTAHPALSAFALYRPRTTPALAHGSRVLRIDDAALVLKKDDRLMLGEPTPAGAYPNQLQSPEIVTVAETWTAFGAHYVRLKSGLVRGASINSLRAYKIGDAVRHFGHSAPAKVSEVNAQGVPSTRDTSFLRRIDATTTNEVDPNLGRHDMPLDREVKTFEPGMTVIVQGRFSSTAIGGSGTLRTLIREVVSVENRSMTWGMQSGASSVLTVQEPGMAMIQPSIAIAIQPLLNPGPAIPYVYGGTGYAAYSPPGVSLIDTMRYADIRSLSFHPVIADSFNVSAAEVDTAATKGTTLRFYGNYADAQALAGRRLLIVGEDVESLACHVQSVVSPDADGDCFHDVVLNVEVDYADFGYDQARRTVYANIVDASQGKTLDAAAIGSGDARAIFQSFALPKPPLTYRFDAAHTPAQVPELEIRVDGLRWTRVDTLFGAGPLDMVYIVREDASGTSVVQFGDGKTGARLTSGRNNVVALQRIGSGANGPLQTGAKPSATGKLAELDKVFMPLPVTVGAPPESPENARDTAPVRLQSLGRLVSLADYEAETRMLPGVLKAGARWDAPEGTPAIVLTVLTAGGSTSDLAKVRDALTAYSRFRGPARHPVIALQGYRQYLHVDALVGFDPAHDVEALRRAIRLALGVVGEVANGLDGSDGLFGLTQRDFGQSAHTSQLVAAIQNVPGIAWVQLRAAQLLALGSPPEPDASKLPLPTIDLVSSSTLACPTTALLALHTRHLVLGFTADQTNTEGAP